MGSRASTSRTRLSCRRSRPRTQPAYDRHRLTDRERAPRALTVQPAKLTGHRLAASADCVCFVDSNADRNGHEYPEVCGRPLRQFLQLAAQRRTPVHVLVESGGQGVAGSNPVVPTRRTRAALDLRVSPLLVLPAETAAKSDRIAFAKIEYQIGVSCCLGPFWDHRAIDLSLVAFAGARSADEGSALAGVSLAGGQNAVRGHGAIELRCWVRRAWKRCLGR